MLARIDSATPWGIEAQPPRSVGEGALDQVERQRRGAGGNREDGQAAHGSSND
jgi:hypothetical protein